MSLSILIPLYNEEEFIAALLERVLATPLPVGLERELIVVDDGSTDGSAEIVEEYSARHPETIRLIRHGRNRGKGAAVRTALAHARGQFSIIQDSDLEYDPGEYMRLLKPLVEGKADVVYGSRFMIVGERRVLYFWHSVANRLLTELCNLAADLNLTDVMTCYKALRTSLFQGIPLRSNRFGIETELTIKVARRQVRIYEAPISYHGRTYEEGKKIGLSDAFASVWTILRFWFTSDIYTGSGAETLHALSGAPRFNAWMADTVRPFLGSNVLEIGAGIGNLTHALVPRRRRYIATDIDREHLARLHTRFHHRPNLEIRSCNLADSSDFLPLREQVDTVVCLNVLEHLEDDLAGLRNIYSALRPGGRAVILVPHGQEVFGTLDKALGHWRRYSRDELRSRIEQVGLEVEHILDFNRISRPAWYVSGKILRRSVLGAAQMRLFDRFVWLWRRLDKVLPWPPTSVIAVACRPQGGQL